MIFLSRLKVRLSGVIHVIYGAINLMKSVILYKGMAAKNKRG